MKLDDLLNKIKAYVEKPNIKLIRQVYRFARNAHEGQKRVSGEAFLEHPLGVAYILAELELDIVSIAAALLHDVVEDTDVESKIIKKEFGDEIARLVDGVTKLTRLKFKSKKNDRQRA